MSEWDRLTLGFRMESDLHIGFLPNQPGTVVARTRPYVPARTLWGAVTARLTRRLFNNPDGVAYQSVGRAIRHCVRFSYFYLADVDDFLAPRFDIENGSLYWGKLTDREFRARFLASSMSTATASESGAAERESLHEMEVIRGLLGFQGRDIRQAQLAGVAWVARDAQRELHDSSTIRFVAESGTVHVYHNHKQTDIDCVHDLFDGIVVGGERKYGLGRLSRTPVAEPVHQNLVELWPEETHPDAAVSFDRHQPLPAHARVDTANATPFIGTVEILARRDYSSRSQAHIGAGQETQTDGYFFAPGTVLLGPDERERSFQWDEWGRLIQVQSEEQETAGDDHAP